MSRTLIAMLNPKPMLYLSVGWPRRFHDRNGFKYEILEETRLEGFYDWLRHEGMIVGLRWNFVDPLVGTIIQDSLIEKVPNLCVDDYGAMLLFFSGTRDFEGSESCDQDFLDHALYSDGAGHFAFSCCCDWYADIDNVLVSDIKVMPLPSGAEMHQE